jgi:hypothetical protein
MSNITSKAFAKPDCPRDSANLVTLLHRNECATARTDSGHLPRSGDRLGTVKVTPFFDESSA